MKKSACIAGRRPVIEAIAAGRPIDKILFQRHVNGDSIGDIRRLAKHHHIPIQIVPPERLSFYTKSNHQGVIALAANITYLDLQQVIDFVLVQGQLPLFVMLDGVTDTRNIGAIARTAVCCGAQSIIIPDKGVGALHEEAIKASAGALEKIHVCRVGSLLKAIETLHLNGVKVYSSETGAAKKVFQINYSEPCCIIMGAEDSGVHPHLSRAADGHFSIPMAGDFDSLNVSVACGIVLFEALKSRMTDFNSTA